MSKDLNGAQDATMDGVRHSLAHLLAAAVLKKYPDAKLGIGPVIENGFYYDFMIPAAESGEERHFTPDDLKEFEKTMRSLIGKKLPFTGEPITQKDAEKLFEKQPFKLELIREFSDSKLPLTVYKTGDVFMDLCRGGHVENTGEIPADGFKLDKIAGAYWRGSEKNPQMQRIYGLAFASKKELDEFIAREEEAKKRDHRKLGKELKLFALIDEIGPGLPLFYPNGAILRRLVENYITELQESRGYEPIWIPHITKAELYKISGHLDKYDAMYPPMDLKDEAKYYLKPMNCPHFMMLYKTIPHSYRDLPVRYTSTTTNYRYEKSGELAGLTRVRSLTQDDCHVFVRPDQIADEINLMLDMIAEVYKTFGFEDFYVRLSTHDPKDAAKYIGDPKIWADSEAALAKLIENRGWRSEVGVGEAAFYGPKLDFIFKDVLGREWQLSTIQLDMNLPTRFGLKYDDDSGNELEPVVLHRAILGSTERFLGILIEHFGGAFPVWLSPVQAAVLPVSDKFDEYGSEIVKKLRDAGIRAEFQPANVSLGKRIREAKLMKIPYVLVVGEKEKESGSVAVSSRRGDEGQMEIARFISLIEKENKGKTL